MNERDERARLLGEIILAGEIPENVRILKAAPVSELEQHLAFLLELGAEANALQASKETKQ